MSKEPEHIYILHGWTYDPHTAEKWEPFRTALAAAGVQSTFLELPGLIHPLTEPWDMEDYIEWLEQTLPDEPVVLLGHSFGGQLATHFAARFPDRVRTLLLIASSGVRDQSLPAQVKRVVFGSLARTARLLGLKSHDNSGKSGVQLLRKVLYKFARERDYLQATPIQQQTMSRVLSAQVQPIVWLVQARTLLVWGAEDQVTPVSTLNVYTHIPEHVVQIISGARHSPQYTHTAQVVQAVRSFIHTEDGQEERHG